MGTLRSIDNVLLDNDKMPGVEMSTQTDEEMVTLKEMQDWELELKFEKNKELA